MKMQGHYLQNNPVALYAVIAAGFAVLQLLYWGRIQFTLILPNPGFLIECVATVISNPLVLFSKWLPIFLLEAAKWYALYRIIQHYRAHRVKRSSSGIATNSSPTEPTFASMQASGPIIDGQRLQRPAWLTPVSMTLYVIVGAYVVAGLIGMMGPDTRYGPSPTFAGGIANAGSTPLIIGLILGVCGFLAGSSYSSSARDTVGQRFGVNLLPNDHWLTQRVHALAARLELTPPAVGLTSVTNAFAVGQDRNHALVVLGVPLIKGLNSEQLDAVIGHELGHIVSGDMQRMQIAEGFQRMFGAVFGAISTIGMAMTKTRANRETGQAFANFGRQFLFVGSELMVKGLSRSREYHADAVGAALTSPAAMIGALEWIHRTPAKVTPAENQYGYLMFRGSGFRAMFSTHPTLERRKAALESGSRLKAIPYKVGSASETAVSDVAGV